ncbi:MAG: response regulator transcription factor [Coriobacteriia bacterium]|nr:response regulator transcription factor [Coriobacteriia bacterium]
MTYPEDLTVGALTASPKRQVAYLDGEELDLTSREFALLHYLMSKAGRIVSRDEIVEHVWGADVRPHSNTIDVNICHLRDKIGDTNRRMIRSIRGVGYFFAVR